MRNTLNYSIKSTGGEKVAWHTAAYHQGAEAFAGLIRDDRILSHLYCISGVNSWTSAADDFPKQEENSTFPSVMNNSSLSFIRGCQKCQPVGGGGVWGWGVRGPRSPKQKRPFLECGACGTRTVTFGFSGRSRAPRERGSV